jgi:hypothetical protein
VHRVLPGLSASSATQEQNHCPSNDILFLSEAGCSERTSLGDFSLF